MSGFRLGILAAGRTAPEFIGNHGDYPALYERLLAPADPRMTFRPYFAMEDEMPDAVDDCDGWLVSGSRASVCSDEPWMAPLGRFLVGAHTAGAPVVGICFGHQILAEALGGRVEKSARGWGLGVHRYHIEARRPWMAGAGDEFAVQAVHQDQVVVPPPGAEVLATSDFCPCAALAFGRTTMSLQGHPEIDAAYARDLIEARRGGVYPADAADAALATVDTPTDAALVAKWIVAFLKGAAAGR
jgi:GMP synthase-like glutamine amidotransferase